MYNPNIATSIEKQIIHIYEHIYIYICICTYIYICVCAYVCIFHVKTGENDVSNHVKLQTHHKQTGDNTNDQNARTRLFFKHVKPNAGNL